MQENDKKYFINSFRHFINNTNKEFSRKYAPSIRELLNDYIELHNDILQSPDNDKLLNSYHAQLNVMDIFISKNIFYTNDSIIKNDLNFLLNKVKTVKNEKKISISPSLLSFCTSIEKKLQKINLYDYIINLVQKSSVYSIFDSCTETIVNELIYDGYSINYLREWYQTTAKYYKTEVSMNYDAFINEFTKFNKSKSEFNIYMTLKNDNTAEIHNWTIDYNMRIEFIDKNILNEETQKHLQFNSTNRAIKVVSKGIDGFSATYQTINAINSYLLIINLTNNSNYFINEKVTFENTQLNSFDNINTKSNDSDSLLLSMDKREKNDLLDFITYRKEIYDQNIQISEIASIERSLNILKNTSVFNQENRLIELWNVLEYLLSYYSSKSIISKTKDIIPKIMVLYLLKDKLNQFWSLLLSSHHKTDIAEEFLSRSKISANSDRYDTKKLIENINNYDTKLIDQFGYHSIVLNRKYCELGSILNHNCKLTDLIQNTHESIESDILRIYRTRNIIVHSGNISRTNILLKNIRLTQYLSNLTGLILHYKRKNSEHTIKEILYSIPETYNNYLILLKQFDDTSKVNYDILSEIFKPTYLFL
jgi:hypothetical protein